MKEVSTDQANKQANKKYVYGYDLYSESVRKYSPVNDLRTAKNAIVNNIHDYLLHLDEFEANIGHKRKLILICVSIFVSVGITCSLMFGREFFESYPRTKYALMGISGLFCLFACFYGSLHDSDRIVFTVAGPSIHRNDTRRKDYLHALRGRRVCVRVNEVPDSATINIETQLVGPFRLFAPSSVYYSVSRGVPYGRYFSKDGFFYPPPMVEDIDTLLRSLNSALLKKRQ
ncbi:putative lipase domain protein [Trypanosoma rangeli]|uniref:Putative lipase domain protein n=1 Tax=Trypanosoma rangeli TaxID=5698 RepID=A0A3S5ISA1_TRYRA|nr:putative lipase domain protein [Trypanosoma rangeli]RNF10403.1 putative lipase domain protein [Trypanosoma rangeli]|eukprot:RNF10403.1 putative lipase domain protein [Trypanosoma rangeli]